MEDINMLSLKEILSEETNCYFSNDGLPIFYNEILIPMILNEARIRNEKLLSFSKKERKSREYLRLKGEIEFLMAILESYTSPF